MNLVAGLVAVLEVAGPGREVVEDVVEEEADALEEELGLDRLGLDLP